MYGLIHTAMKSMVINQFDEQTWQQIAQEANFTQEQMLTMRVYDDASTFALVEATASVLKTSVANCLREFGRYWVMEFAPCDYGVLLDHTGSNMLRFLENLNGLHDRVATSFSEFKPPRFRLETSAVGPLVHYESNRSGLAEFVVGLLEGLALRFNENFDVAIASNFSSESAEHAIFQLVRRGNQEDAGHE
jgi:guanylate cyclase soluble subunit beta